MEEPGFGLQQFPHAYRQRAVGCDFLGDVTDAGTFGPYHFAFVRQQPEQSFQQNSFAGAVRADDGQDLAGLELEVEPFDDRAPTEADGQIADPSYRRHCRSVYPDFVGAPTSEIDDAVALRQPPASDASGSTPESTTSGRCSRCSNAASEATSGRSRVAAIVPGRTPSAETGTTAPCRPATAAIRTTRSNPSPPRPTASGFTRTGRWVSSVRRTAPARSSVARPVAGSNERIPRSHSNTRSLPPLRIYSAASRNSSSVALRPRSSTTGWAGGQRH